MSLETGDEPTCEPGDGGRAWGGTSLPVSLERGDEPAVRSFPFSCSAPRLGREWGRGPRRLARNGIQMAAGSSRNVSEQKYYFQKNFTIRYLS